MEASHVNELLLQALTHEKGGVLVHQTALKCVVNGDLRVKTAIGASRVEQQSLKSR